MSDNLSAQAGCHLLGLPSELRLLIYEHLFPPCKIDIHAQRESPWVDNEDVHATSREVAVLETCRTIYKEAAPVLYENTEFFIMLACSGRDMYSMSPAGKNKVYGQLLQDLQGRVRSLSNVARKVLLSILLTESTLWKDEEHAWFRELTSALTWLAGASEIRELHITFEADMFSGVSENAYAVVGGEFEHVLAALGEIECHATVTAAFHPSLSSTDAKPSSYLETTAKLQW
jgi:hypothetical protein